MMKSWKHGDHNHEPHHGMEHPKKGHEKWPEHDKWPGHGKWPGKKNDLKWEKWQKMSTQKTSEAPAMEEPRLPDESGWYMPTPSNHKNDNALSARTGAMLTGSAVGIFVLGLVLILLMAIYYRKRKLLARRQRSLAQAQQNLYISGMRFNDGGLDNPTYVVPLNQEEKKIPLDVSTMVSAGDYPALLPPSYQEAIDQSTLPPTYSLDPDDHPEEVPVLRRLSITLPEETAKERTDQDC
ncbi:uncharacterized protein LOC135471189 [Liolophura sinensis]|uniref:uncharacterized protein LOC135471189 n=1 Tax=Liolophura sinensis TaxID=3198878 RepID=UPI003158FF75